MKETPLRSTEMANEAQLIALFHQPTPSHPQSSQLCLLYLFVSALSQCSSPKMATTRMLTAFALVLPSRPYSCSLLSLPLRQQCPLPLSTPLAREVKQLALSTTSKVNFSTRRTPQLPPSKENLERRRRPSTARPSTTPPSDLSSTTRTMKKTIKRIRLSADSQLLLLLQQNRPQSRLRPRQPNNPPPSPHPFPLPSPTNLNRLRSPSTTNPSTTSLSNLSSTIQMTTTRKEGWLKERTTEDERLASKRGSKQSHPIFFPNELRRRWRRG